MSNQVLGGRYRLQRPLGHGGTATVWQACDTRLERNAAVKILDARSRADPAALERLRREARSVARLAHDNIVGMYDVDIAEDAAYLVMELVDGESLTGLLARQGRLPVEQAVSMAAQVCDALGAAHAAGVVHRDIKPSNILVDAAGVAKVCDFGVALLDRAGGGMALTGAGAVVGTCQYMAPEQAAGDPVDGRADLYAVGCVLYAMLTGAPPFAADHPLDVLDLHLNEPPVPLRAHRGDVPPDLHRLVDELLAKHVADRPETAWSVRDRLRAIGGPAISGPGATISGPGAAVSGPGAATLGPGAVSSGAGAASSGPGAASAAELAAGAPTLALPAVVSRAEGRHRTAVLPAPRVWRRRWPLDRTGVLVAVAIAAAMLATTLVLTLLAGGDRPEPSAAVPLPSTVTSPDAATVEPSVESSSAPAGIASSAPSAATASPVPVHVRPIDRLAGLAVLVQREADAGRLKPKAAKSLLRDLEGVARALNDGRNADAAERFAEFRERVSEDGVALPGLDGIAASLRAPD